MNVYPTPKDLEKWIASSHKGDRFVYHTGNLMHDRKFRVNLTEGGFKTVEVQPLADIANAAIEAYMAGYVVLSQHRVGEDLFEYLAIRTKKYKQPPLSERPSNANGTSR